MGSVTSFLYFMIPSALWGNWWADLAEIIFFSSLVYTASSWLKKDRQKPLLLYFYAYCTLLLVSYYAQLSTMSTFLFWATPAACMLFILIHQETLQKNSIALKKHIPAKHAVQEDWIEPLFRSCLIALNKKNAPISCVIEHTDSLHEFLVAQFPLQVPLQENLLDLLLASSSYDPSKLVWLSSSAQLCGINTHWKDVLEKEWLSSEIVKLSTSMQYAIFFATKTNAVIFSIVPETRMVDLVIQGKLYEKISAQHALMLLKKYFRLSRESQTKGALTHENHSKKTTPGQPTA